MSKPFRSLRGLPFRPSVSAIRVEHEQRLQAWLKVQPAKVNRRRARRTIMTLARNKAVSLGAPFAEGLEAVLYQLELEAEQAVRA